MLRDEIREVLFFPLVTKELAAFFSTHKKDLGTIVNATLNSKVGGFRDQGINNIPAFVKKVCSIFKLGFHLFSPQTLSLQRFYRLGLG